MRLDNLKNWLLVAANVVAITALGQSVGDLPKRNAGSAEHWRLEKTEQDAMSIPGIEQSRNNGGLQPQYKAAFSDTPQAVVEDAPRQLQSNVEGLQIWGNVVYLLPWDDTGQDPGLYQYTLSDSKLSMKPVYKDQWIFANGSGAFYDGKFHMISKGYSSFLYCSYDMDTWTQLYREESSTKFQKLVASDCDYDPVTGLTYGCFWNPDTQAYEFASVDYESCTHNTIAPMELFLAIAINSRGVVYGIKEADGGLYTIDKATGEQTLVGLTGVKPTQLQSAAFDRTNDVLYWAVCQENSISYLATVNTETASTKRLAYFPDRAQITCLYIPYHAAGGAPARVVSCEKTTSTSTAGISLKFNMPTTTSTGENLASTNLNWRVTLANEVVEQGQAMPGAAVEVSLEGKLGYNPMTIVVSNDKGDSAPLEMRPWCGLDIPKAVQDVAITIDNAADNKVSITWSSSDTGIHNGFIGSENITYDIVRMPGEKLVGSGVSGTHFSEVLGKDSAGVYYYTITPRLGELKGETFETSMISATGVFTVPYRESFDTKNSFDNFYPVDVNEDGVKWVWNQKPAAAKYLINWGNPANDWLLTPEIAMSRDKLYLLSFDVQTFGSGTVEQLAVAFGTGTAVNTYTELMPTTEFDTENPQHLDFVISVPEDGNYRVGYHCTSSTRGMYLLIENISITNGPAAGAPGKVSNLSVTADPAGQLSAEIKLTAPDKCADGSSLSTISRVEVRRDEETEPVKVFTDVTPSLSLSFTDTPTVTGVNKYSAVAVNDEGSGIAVSAEAYVGQDRPYGPATVTLEDRDSKYTLTWTSPVTEGIDFGYPVIVDQLTYHVYGPDQSLIAENIEGTTYDITGDFLTGAQNMQSFYVSAVSPAGESPLSKSNTILVGKPYTLPFRESFKGGLPPSTFWWVGGYNCFKLNSEMDYDGDGGSICWKANYFDTESWFNSGKIDISNAKKPSFSFAYRVLPGKKFILKAYVSVEGGSDIELGTINFETATGEECWKVASFDLTPYVDSKYVIVKIYNENSEPYVDGQELKVYVDRICVVDSESPNLSIVAINAPAALYVNQTGVINTTVENTGSRQVEYSVALYNGENLVSTSAVSTIEPYKMATTKFEYTPDVVSVDSLSLHTEIICSDDTFDGDNISDAVAIKVLRPDYAIVDDLEAVQAQTDGEVILSWSEPTQNSGPVAESFEEYMHKDLVFGKWTTIDGDGGLIYTNQVVDVGYHNVPLSWAVFNTIAAVVPEAERTFYEAHTGETSILSIASQPTTIKHGDRNDDWLISPEISASVPHTVSFWAKSVKGDRYGLEKLEILYTAGHSNVPEEFTSLGVYEVPSAWTQFTVDVPKGARFFAIRNISQDMYYLMVDDIEFEVGQMEIMGYHVIRNGEKIASLPATETSYIDTEVAENGKEDDYYVTVVYANGESGLSNRASYQHSGIEGLEALPEGPFDIYSIDGKLVRKDATTTEGLPQGFYIVGNKKVAVF